MVKPPKSMQPGGIERDDVKNPHRGMGGESFRHYMARKIELQREQFGVQEPPTQKTRKRPRSERSHYSSSGISLVLERLKRRYGKRKERDSEFVVGQTQGVVETSSPSIVASPKRSDLFFRGVVVLVNGYTQPDNETLMRMLHKHGGDLEKYETTRVTHILAEHLSAAKAKIYLKQRKPIPVVSPKWIVACDQAGKLLPYGPYLIEEVKSKGAGSVRSFFPPPIPLRSVMFSEEKPLSTRQELQGLEDEYSSVLSQAEETVTQLHTQCLDLRPHFAGEQQQMPDHYKGMWLTENNDQATGPVPSTSNFDKMLQQTQMNNESGNLSAAVPNEEQSKPRHKGWEEMFVDERRNGMEGSGHGRTDDRYINGKIRTVGTDPNFLTSFFNSSRLSFIGSFKQRAKETNNGAATICPGGADKQRFVFHVDMDCFFASVALRHHPELRDKPVAISHHGKQGGSDVSTVSERSTSECATCNYEARKFGIKKGMFLGRARQICPDLVVLQYDFEGYEEVAQQVFDILQRNATVMRGEVEQVSCDECFLELFLPADDSNTDSASLAKELAEGMRTEIEATTSCSATIGVGSNKLIAKLATDTVKPNGCRVVTDYKAVLERLRLRDLHGIGFRGDKKLRSEGLCTVRDVWDLGDRAESILSRVLGPALGKKILSACFGEDDRPVRSAPRKTIGAECNYGVRFNGPYGVDWMIAGLAKEVQRRMDGVGVKGSKLTLKVKQRKKGAKSPPKFLGHGSCHNLSRSTDIPGSLPTRQWSVFSRVGFELFEQLAVPADQVRGMGLVVSKLTEDKSGRAEKIVPAPLTDWFSGADLVEKPGYVAKGDRDKACNLTQHDVSTPKKAGQSSYNKDPTKAPRCDRVTLGLNTHSPKTQIGGQEGDPLTYHDIAIPAHSQIHMSQVDALPSPFRRGVLQRMREEAGKRCHLGVGPISAEAESTAISSEQTRYKVTSGKGTGADGATEETESETRSNQVSVKHLLKLAQVKYGKDNLADALGDPVSLTQLECLPLQLQLQVANTDEKIQLQGSRKQKASSSSKEESHLRPSKDSRVSSSIKKTSHGSSNKLRNTAVEHNDTQAEDILEGKQKTLSIFQRDIAPLQTFLDGNPGVSTEALSKVSAFLCMCIEDRRIEDVVKMLRSIRNRTDGWGKKAYHVILDQTSRKVRDVIGFPLDIHQLRLV